MSRPSATIVERHGWRVEIRPDEPRKRPQWEIRCEIYRAREGERQRERRGHRFYVSPDLAAETGLDRMPSARRRDRLWLAAKRIIMRELDEIFSEPEGGLEAVRPILAADLSP